jgi:RNA polymerase sigma factor (TIGR02999 family)
VHSTPFTPPASIDGEAAAASEELFQTLYAELHRLARRELRRNAMVTLSATELLHEAFLDLSKRDGVAFPDRARFMTYAARAMRGLVIDYARQRKAQKRGGEFRFTALDTSVCDGVADDRQLSGIADALDELATVDAPLAQLVDLKFFCGLSTAEIAALRGVSARTVERDWTRARVYLRRTLSADADID